MANLTEINNWEPAIYQLAPADPVEGGAGGISNLQAKQLANRTKYLKVGQDAVVLEVDTARGDFPTLHERLDASDTKAIEAVYFRGATPNTGGGNFQNITGYAAVRFGTAADVRDPSTFKLTKPGLYELLALHKVEGTSPAADGINASLKAFLVHDGGTPQLIDSQGDTADSEPTEGLYHLFLVDSSWADPYIYLQRDGAPAGFIRGSIKYLGQPPADPLVITTANPPDFMEGATQTYPDFVLVPLAASGAVGAVTWSVIPGAGLQDGTTDPKAEIVSGNQLKLTWTAAPTVPATWSVKVQAVDEAGTPRTTQKTLAITLDPYSVATLAIDSTDKAFTASSYPYAVAFTAAASGGVAPYTWALVGGGTTLPSAAINSSTGAVTGSASGPGTTTVELQATDSAGTPVTVTKTINVAVATASGGGGGVPGCAPAGTPFGALGGDIPIETVEVGTLVRAYDDQTFLPVTAIVEEVLVYQDRPLMRITTDKGQVVVSRDHRAASPGAPIGPWMQNYPPVEALQPGMPTKWETAAGVIEDAVVLEVEDLGLSATVYHVRLDKGHLFIAGGLVSHNIKVKTM